MQAATIRTATPRDFSTIEALAHRIWPAAYGHILSETQLRYMLSLFYTPENLQRQALEGQHFFLLEAPEAIGFAAAGPVAEHHWKLHKLYILPAQQGKGLGKKLLNFITQEAISAGATTISLQVNRANPAIRFYRHEGFRILATKDFDIGKGFFMNDYVMAKNL